jgi:hypothetical protein
MSMKPNPKEINIILYILKGAQFEFLPRAPFYIDTPLCLLIILDNDDDDDDDNDDDYDDVVCVKRGLRTTQK